MGARDIWSLEDLHDPERIATIRSRRQLRRTRIATVVISGQHHLPGSWCDDGRGRPTTKTIGAMLDNGGLGTCTSCTSQWINKTEHGDVVDAISDLVRLRRRTWGIFSHIVPKTSRIPKLLTARWTNTAIIGNPRPAKLWWDQVGPRLDRLAFIRQVAPHWTPDPNRPKILFISDIVGIHGVLRSELLAAGDHVVQWAPPEGTDVTDRRYHLHAVVIDEDLYRLIVAEYLRLRARRSNRRDDGIEADLDKTLGVPTVPLGAVDDDTAAAIAATAAELAADHLEGNGTMADYFEERRTLGVLALVAHTAGPGPT